MHGHTNIIVPVMHGHTNIIVPVMHGHTNIIVPVMHGHTNIIVPVMRGHTNIIVPVMHGHTNIIVPVMHGHTNINIREFVLLFLLPVIRWEKQNFLHRKVAGVLWIWFCLLCPEKSNFDLLVPFRNIWNLLHSKWVFLIFCFINLLSFFRSSYPFLHYSSYSSCLSFFVYSSLPPPLKLINP